MSSANNLKDVKIRKCARCGEDHTLDFAPLDNHDEFAFWSLCPTAEQPILLAKVKNKDWFPCGSCEKSFEHTGDNGSCPNCGSDWFRLKGKKK